MRRNWQGSRETLLGQVVQLVEQFLESRKIRIEAALFEQDDLRRRLIITLNMNKVVQHIFESIGVQNTETLEPQFDRERPIRSTGDMMTWYTGRPNTRNVRTSTSAFSIALGKRRKLLNSTGTPRFGLFAKNDHLGFEILYVYSGVVRKYRPDFLIRLANRLQLVLETKGQETDRDRAKRAALDEWIHAVNSDARFGCWAAAVSKSPADISDILGRSNEFVMMSQTLGRTKNSETPMS